MTRINWSASRWVLSALLLACSFANLAASASAQDQAQRLPAIRLNAGIHVIRAEVAESPDQRSIGLMHRDSMPSNDGMLFVFEQAAVQCFWMKNTRLPLSIAFLSDDGEVINIEAMAPQTLNSHCSKKPVRLALEMNAGWFDKRGIKAGSKLQGEPFSR